MALPEMRFFSMLYIMGQNNYAWFTVRQRGAKAQSSSIGNCSGEATDYTTGEAALVKGFPDQFPAGNRIRALSDVAGVRALQRSAV